MYINHVSYGYKNMTFFGVQDGKCKDFVDQSLGLYTTDCDDSTRTFYLSINNVTDVYNGEKYNVEWSIVRETAPK